MIFEPKAKGPQDTNRDNMATQGNTNTGSNMGKLAAGLAVAAMVGMARAHEHHGEDIPEGEAVSAEPLVSASSDQLTQPLSSHC